MSGKFHVFLKILFEVHEASVNSVDDQFQNDPTRDTPASVHTCVISHILQGTDFMANSTSKKL